MVKFLIGVYIQHTFDNKDFSREHIMAGNEASSHLFRVPIDDSIVYRLLLMPLTTADTIIIIIIIRQK